MANIGVAGFLHETNTFSPHKTSWTKFVEADAWPGLLCGNAVTLQTRDMNIAVSGFISAIGTSPHQVLPLLWASAGPSGVVEAHAFEYYWQLLKEALEQTPKLDALFLDLHGAMVAEHLHDCEGELLTRIRALLGDTIPIVCALDFHANVSEAMCQLATVMIGYRYYPHTDMFDTGVRCAKVLTRILNKETFHLSTLKFDFLISLPWQATDTTAMKRIIDAIERTEQQHELIVSFLPGFPLADVPFLGPRVLVYAAHAELATRVTAQLAEIISAHQSEFNDKLYSIAEALAFTKAHQENGQILWADTQDNPGGGGDGDGTDILHALLEAKVQNGCLGVLCDPAAASAAHKAGIHQYVTHPLGATMNRLGRGAVPGPWKVLALSDGKFLGTGPFYRGCKMDLGLMAVLEQHGFYVVVSSRPQQAADQAMFRHLGFDPAQFKLLVLKSSVHFRADFAATAAHILVIAAPGSNVADLTQLRYTHYR